MRNVGVYRDDGPLPRGVERIEAFERLMGVRLPEAYKTLVSAHNHLYPEEPEIEFLNPWGTAERRSIFFLGFDTPYENIEESQPASFAPDDGEMLGIVVFGEDAGGDYVGFDYRDCPGTDDPPVVFLYHDLWWPDEAGEWHRVIWPIAPSFDVFLEMLYERDDSFLDEGNEDGA